MSFICHVYAYIGHNEFIIPCLFVHKRQYQYVTTLMIMMRDTYWKRLNIHSTKQHQSDSTSSFDAFIDHAS